MLESPPAQDTNTCHYNHNCPRKLVGTAKDEFSTVALTHELAVQSLGLNEPHGLSLNSGPQIAKVFNQNAREALLASLVEVRLCLPARLMWFRIP